MLGILVILISSKTIPVDKWVPVQEPLGQLILYKFYIILYISCMHYTQKSQWHWTGQ